MRGLPGGAARLSEKRVFAVFFSFCLFLLALPLPAQKSSGRLSASESASLKQGADAYRSEDWTSAIFFLRKAVASQESASDETYFMLIKSEIYAGEYGKAQGDCEKFLSQFPYSPYEEYVRYQNGRLLHLLARNEDAILSLSDFCHRNDGSELFPLALFWIAESFYDEYNFESARGLYERVVTDYPACEKAPQAQYKLDLIERRAREEKLLYLLKMIGEENLSTREEYERQLRVYALEDDKDIKKSLIDAQARIAELEALLEDGGHPARGTEMPPAAEAAAGSVTEAPVQAEITVSSGWSASLSPRQFSDSIIQDVGDPAIRDRQNQSGAGASAVRNTGDSSKEAEFHALKRKARQLQYLLEEQDEEDSK